MKHHVESVRTDGYTIKEEGEEEGMKLLNAFSLNMTPEGGHVSIETIDAVEVRRMFACRESIDSFVGHEETAAVFSDVLSLPVRYHRGTVVLKDGERVIVGQYIGPRLPEGAVALPEGARIDWFRVRFWSRETALHLMRMAVDGLLPYDAASDFVPGTIPART